MLSKITKPAIYLTIQELKNVAKRAFAWLFVVGLFLKLALETKETS